MDYLKLNPINVGANGSTTSPFLQGDNLQLKVFKHSRIIEHNFVTPPTSLDFNVNSPYDLAVSASSRVSIFNGRNSILSRSINRFDGVAFSGSFRPTDGKLVLAGDDQGHVRVFEKNGRAALRYCLLNVFKGVAKRVCFQKQQKLLGPSIT